MQFFQWENKPKGHLGSCVSHRAHGETRSRRNIFSCKDRRMVLKIPAEKTTSLRAASDRHLQQIQRNLSNLDTAKDEELHEAWRVSLHRRSGEGNRQVRAAGSPSGFLLAARAWLRLRRAAGPTRQAQTSQGKRRSRRT